ncbi:MAG TPA: hypothetical protein PKD55_10795 [Bellilinea sp.]|nr:hypothetical protein [Bellilinea sp.]
MTKYRKKPVIVEAFQYSYYEIWPFWFTLANRTGKVVSNLEYCEIETLEGKMRCAPGDWIIRGVEGEIYPCKDAIFRATYEPVEGGELIENPDKLPEGGE